jgi:hypothetical protein
MPLSRYVKKGVVFTPEALSAMSQALEATAQILSIEGDEKQREIVAKFIIRTAGEEDSLDATALRDRVLAALGGVSYYENISSSSANISPSTHPLNTSRRLTLS